MSNYIPIEIVERLSKQGLTEREIISQLKLRGFTEDQINKAVNQSIKEGVIGKPGIPARPHVNANKSNLPIIRHPDRKMEEPQSNLPEKQSAPTMTKPPEHITLPQHLKPMGLSQIGAHKYEPVAEKIAPVAPHTPKPLDLPQTERKLPEPVKVPIAKVSASPIKKPIAPGHHKPLRHPPTAKHPRPKPLKPVAQQDITLEELVEEVVSTEIKKVNKTVGEMKTHDKGIQEELQKISEKISRLAKMTGQKTKHIETELGETSKRIISMENRISALETAFKSIGSAINKTKPKRK